MYSITDTDDITQKDASLVSAPQTDTKQENKFVKPSKDVKYMTRDERMYLYQYLIELNFSRELYTYPKDKKSCIPYTCDEILQVLKDVNNIFESERMLVDYEAPTYVVGDIHGQFNDLLCIFRRLGSPPTNKYLFLGDYVDRGSMGIDVIMLLFLYKIKYFNSVVLLRGNHEIARINKNYGFYAELKDRFGAQEGRTLFVEFNQVFDMMPVFGLIAKKIFCMHGGLSPTLYSIKQLRDMTKPVKNPMTGVVSDMMWSDPVLDKRGWQPSGRGCSFQFGEDVVHTECKRLGVELIVRAHQVCLEGYAFCAEKKMLTIFSAPNYCGTTNNAAGVLEVKQDLTCQLHIFVPEQEGGDKPSLLPKICSINTKATATFACTEKPVPSS